MSLCPPPFEAGAYDLIGFQEGPLTILQAAAFVSDFPQKNTRTSDTSQESPRSDVRVLIIRCSVKRMEQLASEGPPNKTLVCRSELLGIAPLIYERRGHLGITPSASLTASGGHQRDGGGCEPNEPDPQPGRQESGRCLAFFVEGTLFSFEGDSKRSTCKLKFKAWSTVGMTMLDHGSRALALILGLPRVLVVKLTTSTMSNNHAWFQLKVVGRVTRP